MKRTQNKYLPPFPLKYLLIAFCSHLIFISGVNLYLENHEINEVSHTALNAFVYSRQKVIAPKRVITASSMHGASPSIIQRRKQEQPLNVRTAAKTTRQQEKKDNRREILNVLHEVIAENQAYPISSLQLNQQGVVTIGFVLAPDGTITQISILKSSGFQALDASALHTITDISPIKLDGLYLQKAEFFSIDIRFE